MYPELLKEIYGRVGLKMSAVIGSNRAIWQQQEMEGKELFVIFGEICAYIVDYNYVRV